MKRICLIVLLGVLLLPLASPAAAQSFDWCYGWDLTQQNPFTVYEGYWFQGVGYRTDETFSHQLDLVYNHDQVVPPLRVMLRFGSTQTASTSLAISGSAFTIPLDGNFTIPANSVTHDLFFIPDSNTINVGSNIFNIEVSASHFVDLRMVAIFGNGANPFPVNNCYVGSPISTPVTVGSDNLLEALATASAALEAADGDLGASQLPQENGAVIFRYAKWLLSPTAADEIAGPFSPIFIHIGYAVTMLIGLGVLYGVVYGASTLIRIAVWIFNMIMKIITAAAAIVDTVVGSVFKFARGVLGL